MPLSADSWLLLLSRADYNHGGGYDDANGKAGSGRGEKTAAINLHTRLIIAALPGRKQRDSRCEAECPVLKFPDRLLNHLAHAGSNSQSS